MIWARFHAFEMERDYFYANRVVRHKQPANNQLAPERLILVFCQVGFGYNVLGNWGGVR